MVKVKSRLKSATTRINRSVVTPFSMQSIIALGMYAVTIGWKTSAGTRIKKYIRLFLSHAIQFFSMYFKFDFMFFPFLKSALNSLYGAADDF